MKDNYENIERYHPDLEVGLTSAQVAQRNEEGLVNRIPKHVSKSYWRILLDNVLNFFNILLFGLSILMIIAQIEITAFGFLFILIINIIIGLYQDIHARHLVDKLRVVSYPVVNVLREAGAQVLGIVSIFTYGMQKGIDRLAAADVKNISLTDFDTVAQVAADTGYIKPEDVAKLIKFRNNPSDESWITL